MSKDKHALIKANIALNRRVQELERDVRYLRERENKIIEINQHRMKYLAEVESRNIVLEQQNKRYREAIEETLQAMGMVDRQKYGKTLERALEGDSDE